MKRKLLSLLLAIILIMVTVWNMFILNYLNSASKDQQMADKFENICKISPLTIKRGLLVSTFILIMAVILFFAFAVMILKGKR